MRWLREAARDRGLPGLVDPIDRSLAAGGLAVILVLLAVVAVMLDASALDVWTGLILSLVLVIVSVPMCTWIARREDDQKLFPILFGGIVAHMVFALVRYFFIFSVYKGSADAGKYHEAGVTFANNLRDGRPLHPIPIMEGFPAESQRIGDVVGGLYTVTGPSAYAGFFAFSWLCAVGLILMVRAFKVALPEGDYRRYALLVMFLPSLLFWPSSIGKEALMIFCLGIISYGAALLLAPRPQVRGAWYFTVGLLLVSLVRPHVALMSAAGLVLALMVAVMTSARATERLGSRGRLVRIVGLVVMVAVALAVVSRIGDVLEERGQETSAAASLEQATEQTSIGNSEFTPVAVASPQALPAAIVSVVFRPFPWEARNANSLIAAAESLVLAGIFVLSWRRVLSFPRLATQRPFLLFCSTYVVAFSVGFSFIANFGILARQRVQVLPAVLALVALPPYVASRKRARAGIVEEAGILTGDVAAAGSFGRVETGT